jgi:hypothetical protein
LTGTGLVGGKQTAMDLANSKTTKKQLFQTMVWIQTMVGLELI